MITREDVATYTPTRDLSLQSPPNWTAVIFFATLSGLHLSIAIPAFLHQRWEGYLSFVLAGLFAFVAICSFFARYEMTIHPKNRSIHLRHLVGPFRSQRLVSFSDVHAVRLTLNSRKGRTTESHIEILCDNEDIDCPPTLIPRQQALFLAILMGVQLIKVSNDVLPDTSNRLI